MTVVKRILRLLGRWFGLERVQSISSTYRTRAVYLKQRQPNSNVPYWHPNTHSNTNLYSHITSDKGTGNVISQFICMSVRIRVSSPVSLAPKLALMQSETQVFITDKLSSELCLKIHELCIFNTIYCMSGSKQDWRLLFFIIAPYQTYQITLSTTL